ncbi:hypothetical protein K2173_012365 [Erythroxylum novogranatense]|uniref:Methyltransferase n=1 Tax=Erythroxylum novogranatense TaxID=1862640 RepID=A0AAV8U9R2_9ROSI|nr:hypothetical protein K2173_012365 [Erythroxylum novogranatense]
MIHQCRRNLIKFHLGFSIQQSSCQMIIIISITDLATSFYEFGWGESFHFAHRFKGEPLRESIKRHEHFLALQLGLKPRQKVLDLGCGIGGPLREISRFRFLLFVISCILTSVTGLNNNEYQITRGKELNHIAGVDKTCDFLKADFMKMPFPENSFDAVYAIEATCHAPDAEIEIGDGLPDIRLTGQCLEGLKKAGFEILPQGHPPLDKNHFSFGSFRLTAVGRFFTKNMKAAEGLVEGGRREIFTPMFFFLARKPLVDSQ